MKRKRIAVVYTTYDGALNCTCGVGVLSQYFINSFPQIRKTLSDHVDLSLHVVAVSLNENGHGYSNEIKQKTEQITVNSGGKLHLIDNGTNASENFGNINNWELASKNAASIITEIASSYDFVITYLVDTPFLGVPQYYSRSVTGKIISYLVPHSDVYSHFANNIDSVRLEWETFAFKQIAILKNLFLASTSVFLTNNVKLHHNIPAEKIIAMQTGLLLTDKRFEHATKLEIETKLQAYKIPLDKDLIFSVARAVPYKGFEDLIESFALIANANSNAHLVFVASPFRNSASNVEELKLLITKHNLDSKVTAIYNLEMELPRIICQWERTRIVAQLSHREPFGLVPEEVRIWAKDVGPVIVASNLDGFVEQITDKEDGFLVNPFDHKTIANLFLEIFNMDTGKLTDIKKKGYERATQNYNYVNSITNTIYEGVKRS